MNRIYNEIMELTGADEFKGLIQKWDALSDNLRSNPKSLPRLLPNLLWVGNSGIGRTNLMKLMSGYLASKGNLLDFYGDTKYFEFLLSYIPAETSFTELQRLEEELTVAKGFRNEFRGAVLIDIDPWVEHYEELYFIGFMEYLAAHSDQWMIVLSVSEMEEEKLQNLEAFLSMYLRLDRITLPLPEAPDLLAFVAKKLQTYDLSLEESARELLLQTIDELRKNQYFDGYKTISMLCQDIVYEHFSSENADKKILSAENLESFAAGSNYVKKAIKSSKRRIGFNREEA